MLPFDRKPWAKSAAAIVILIALLSAACLAVYFHRTVGLHISELAIIVLLLLTVVPPNAAILLRKPGEADPVLTRKGLNHTI